MLYKYNDNGNPTNVYIVDWQMTRYASPICDIVYFIFTSTMKEMRDKHYDDFLKTYHESLSYHLNRLGSDPEKLFPYHIMVEELQRFGKFGM